MWHANEPSLLNGHEGRASFKILQSFIGYRLHMSERFLSGTKKHQTNKQKQIKRTSTLIHVRVINCMYKPDWNPHCEPNPIQSIKVC